MNCRDTHQNWLLVIVIYLSSICCACTDHMLISKNNTRISEFIEIQQKHIMANVNDIETLVPDIEAVKNEDVVNKNKNLTLNVEYLRTHITDELHNKNSEYLLEFSFSALFSLRKVYVNLKEIENALTYISRNQNTDVDNILNALQSISSRINENLKEEEDILNELEIRISSIGKYMCLLTSPNLFPDGAISQNKNGISVTPRGDGSFVFDGTPTVWTSYNLCRYENELPTGLYPSEEYYISFKETPPGATYYIQYYEDGVTSPITLMTLSETFSSGKFILPENAKGFRVWVHMSPTYCICNDTELEVVMVSTKSSYYSNLLIEENHPARKDPLPILTIIDDDGFRKFNDLLLPIIIEKQVPIASSIPTSEVGVIDKVMTWDEITNCANYGAEILSHTHSNLSRKMAEGMSVNEIAYDYRRSQYILRNHGFKSETLVFVGDSSNDPKCIEACKQVFANGIKAGTNKTNYFGTINRYQINRWSVNPGDSVDKLKGKIDELIELNTGWMIWMIHTSSGDFQQPFADILVEAIDYALDRGVIIGTTEYAIRQYCD